VNTENKVRQDERTDAHAFEDTFENPFEDKAEQPAIESSDAAELGASFADLGLSKDILKNLKEVGFEKPSPIQEKSIPLLLQKKDIVGVAQTGSGKTAAFVLPILQNLKHDKTIEALVLVPTRELCTQVVKAFKSLSGGRLRVLSIVGGEPYRKQLQGLRGDDQIVVATPGRLLDLLTSYDLERFKPKTLVLDEADEMMDMGFLEPIRKILGAIPKIEQRVLFSATMPKPIARLIKEEFSNPVHVNVASNKPHADITQSLYLIKGQERDEALRRILAVEQPDKVLIFCRTKRGCEQVCQMLVSEGVTAKSLHGDHAQRERRFAIEAFRDGKTKALIATDVASRGLDIKDLDYVINYDFPDNRERYLHRVGRTGRGGQTGKALSLATLAELQDAGFGRGNKDGLPFQAKQLPTLKDISFMQRDRFWADVLLHPIAKEKLLESQQILLEHEPEEVLAKLLTMLENKNKLSGPNEIGFKPSKLRQMLDAASSGSSSRNFARRRKFGRGSDRRGGSSSGSWRGSSQRRGGSSGGGYSGGGRGRSSDSRSSEGRSDSRPGGRGGSSSDRRGRPSGKGTAGGGYNPSKRKPSKGKGRPSRH
jgi:ATP-dependent RNA helicase DeaD